MHRFSGRLAHLAILIAALLCLALPAKAGPASDLIGRLNTAFTAVTQNAKALGYEGRYEKLKPAIVAAYDFSEMARVTTGRYWSSFTDDQKQQVVAAFRDLSIATYAARFDGSSSQRFEILGEEPASGGNLRVNNQVVPASGEPIRVDYLLRQDGGAVAGHRRLSEVIRERTGRAPRRIHENPRQERLRRTDCRSQGEGGQAAQRRNNGQQLTRQSGEASP